MSGPPPLLSGGGKGRQTAPSKWGSWAKTRGFDQYCLRAEVALRASGLGLLGRIVRVPAVANLRIDQLVRGGAHEAVHGVPKSLLQLLHRLFGLRAELAVHG